MNCRSLNDSELPLWDAFVKSQPEGRLFHSTRWLNAVARQFEVFACFVDGRIVAGLPIEWHRRYGVTVAHQPSLTPYLGVLCSTPSEKRVAQISRVKEVSSIIAKALTERYDSVAFNFSPDWVDLHGFMWSGFSTAVRYTYLVDLMDIDSVWSEMDARRRNDIRRAEKDGIDVRISDDFGEAERLVSATFRRQGMAPGFLDIARRVHAAMREEGRCALFVAHSPESAEPIAAVYLVWDDSRAYYLLGGYDDAQSHGGAHALAIWKAIQFAAAKQLPQFDFEGSNLPHVEKYFRKFGGRITPYYRVSWSSPRARTVDGMRSIVRRPAGVLRRILKLS